MSFTLKSLVPTPLQRFMPWNSGLANPDRWLVEALFGHIMSAAGVKVTPLKAMAVSTVYACVNRISGTVSTIPLKLCQKLPDGNRRDATEHYLYGLMHDSPIPGEMTSVRFRRTMQANKSLRNIAHALIVRNGLGEIAELVPIPAHDISMEKPDVNSSHVVYRVRGEIIEPSRLFTLVGMTFDGVVPLDMVGTSREAVGLAIALQDNAAKFFANGSRPGAVLEHPGKLGKASMDRLRESFEKNYKGTDKAYGVAILEEGLKLVSQRQTGGESQMDESRARQALEICQFFGVPPHKVGILDNATFSNIEEQNIEYVVDCITAELVEWEQTMNMKLLTEEERKDGYYFTFVVDGLTRGSITTRYAAYSVARNWGWLSRNDIRKLENMSPIPGGDAYDTPPNSATSNEQPPGSPPKTPKTPSTTQETQ